MKKLKKLFRPEYRVYKDRDGYYRRQRRVWWCPLWATHDATYASMEYAEEVIKNEAKKNNEAGVVKYLGRL